MGAKEVSAAQKLFPGKENMQKKDIKKKHPKKPKILFLRLTPLLLLRQPSGSLPPQGRIKKVISSKFLNGNNKFIQKIKR